jgi:hypothetical protein
MLVLLGVFVLEAAAVAGLMAAGWPAWLAALTIGALNIASGFGTIKWMGKRKANDGPVFEMTKAEFERTSEWMRKNFFSHNNGSVHK